GGNNDVILCERGIRTFETATRNTFDISAIPVVKKLSHLPNVADPSHGAARHGRADGARRGRRRRRRADHRGALRSRPRAQRRRAVDVPVAVRPPDGGAADHRAGDRPQHLPRAGRATRLGKLEVESLESKVEGGRHQSMAKELPVIQPGAQRQPAAPPIFSKIGIIGLGLIGGSVALRARELWPSALVIAVDNKDVLEEAMRRHAVDVAADDLVVLAEADLVILSAPVKQNIALLAELDENVRVPAIVTDTGSTKREIVEAARE